MARIRVPALIAAVTLAACGGTSAGDARRATTPDPGRDAGAARGSGGTPDASGIGLLGSGGETGGQRGTGGLPGIGPDAARHLIEGISGPSGPCPFAGMTCETAAGRCTCAAGRKWDCSEGADAARLELPARIPNAYDDCAFEGVSCTGWEACAPTCTCGGGSWSCVAQANCTPPRCDPSPEDGAACDAPGLRCGGGCRSCTCELTADFASYAWTCVYAPC